MTARIESLIEDKYSVLKFSDMPTHYQMSIVWHTVMDCFAWNKVIIPDWKDEAEAKLGLGLLLSKFVEMYGEELFGVAIISADSLKLAVMQDESISDSFSCWEDYHSSYIMSDTPEHPPVNRWPLILSTDNYETIYDGWHRFHSYIRDGAIEIPAIFYPQKHHLSAFCIV